MHGENQDDVVARLRRQNEELKDLVAKALRAKLAWGNVPKELWEDRRFALCKPPKEITAQDDRDVVLGALRSRRGSGGWHKLPPKWKGDVAVACAAFEQSHGYGE